MTSAFLSSNEEQRLAAVRRYDVLDTPPDGAFDRITTLAARLFRVPIAIVSIVDTDRIWFKSHHGLNSDEIDRNPGLCASAILQAGPWIIENAHTDPRSLANPLVAGESGFRFYAGVPLTTQDGYNLGTLCVIDREPRRISEDEIANLQDLASLVMDELELRLSVRTTLALRTEVVERMLLARALSERDSDASDQRPTLDRRLRIYDREVKAGGERHDAENQLRHALVAEEFQIAYQPIVALRSGEVTGVEALIRWQHPTRGELLPGAFLALAEEMGLLSTLDEYVKSTACRQVAEWNRNRARDGRPPLDLAVNCAGAELTAPSFFGTMQRLLLDCGLTPAQLTIEITESSFINATMAEASGIEELVRLGVHLAIDDFGTGYSSLSYLRRFTVSSVKIDRSFIAGIGKCREDEVIVAAVVNLAHSLGATAVGEGVETPEQEEYLRLLGCDYGQGYHFGKPGVGWCPPR